MSFARDLFERALKTSLQAALATWATLATTVDVTSASSWRALLGGGIAAGLSAVSSVLSAGVGTPGTASAADRPAVDELGNLETAP